MVLLAFVDTFSSELERGTWLILQTAKYGKRKTMLAKYLAAAISAAGIMALMELTTAAPLPMAADNLAVCIDSV